jgi:glutathione peroxidase
MTSSLYDIAVQRIDGKDASLRDYAGSVLLIVNVASQCGKTPQYEGLEAMYKKYRGKGFAVLGFPSNQFKGQEPGTNEEIAEFCRTVYGVDFPMFAKIDVNGPERHPLYRVLTEAQPARSMSPAAEKAGKKPTPGADVRWNFEKFLVNRTGEVVGRFDPDVVPGDEVIVRAVEDELANGAAR